MPTCCCKPDRIVVGGLESRIAKAQPILPLSFRQPAEFCSIDGTPGNCPTTFSPVGFDVADILGPSPSATPDGFPEVVVCNRDDGRISVIRNAGAGNWVGNPPVNGMQPGALGCCFYLPGNSGTVVTEKPQDVVIADMNADGLKDLVITAQTAPFPSLGIPRVYVYFNTGQSTFALATSTEVADNRPQFPAREVYGLSVADFNADGIMDIAVAGSYDNSEEGNLRLPQFAILYGPQGGWIAGNQQVVVQRQLQMIEFNGYPVGGAFPGAAIDVEPVTQCPSQLGGDLMITINFLPNLPGQSGNEYVVVAQNTGPFPDGRVNWVNIAVVTQANAFGAAKAGLGFGAVGDHVLVATRQPVSGYQGALDFASFVPQGCAPQFLFAPPPITIRTPYGIAAGRIDLNNSQDFVLACQTSISGAPWPGGGVAIYQNKETAWGEFHNPVYLSVLPAGSTRLASPRFVKINDMNNDFRNDLVTTNLLQGSFSVLINKTPLPEY